jgi:hypothetical protein
LIKNIYHHDHTLHVQSVIIISNEDRGLLDYYDDTSQVKDPFDLVPSEKIVPPSSSLQLNETASRSSTKILVFLCTNIQYSLTFTTVFR